MDLLRIHSFLLLEIMEYMEIPFLDRQQYKQLKNRVCWAHSSCDHSLFVWLEKEKDAKKETFIINFHKSAEQGNQSL